MPVLSSHTANLLWPGLRCLSYRAACEVELVCDVWTNDLWASWKVDGCRAQGTVKILSWFDAQDKQCMFSSVRHGRIVLEAEIAGLGDYGLSLSDADGCSAKLER